MAKADERSAEVKNIGEAIDGLGWALFWCTLIIVLAWNCQATKDRDLERWRIEVQATQQAEAVK